MRGIGCTALAFSLGLVGCGEPLHAQIGDPPGRHLDPAVLTPAAVPACTPFAGGHIAAAARVGEGTVVIARTLDPITLTGYQTSDGIWVLELRRTSDLSLVWARTLEIAPIALAVSRDAQRVAVATYSSTHVLDAATGAPRFEHAGVAYALAFGPHGELALAGSTDVEVVDDAGASQRAVAITGTAPSVVHAMGLDGECRALYEDVAARAQVLAFSDDGALFAGTSDGAVRVLATDDHARWSRPQAHAWGYAISAVALEPTAHGVRATYGDGFALSLTPTAMRGPASPHAAECSDAELAIARRRLGPSAEAEPATCAYVRSVDVDAAHRRLFVGAVSTVRDAHGTSSLVAPTLRTDAGVLVGDEAWLFGVDGIAERWTLGRGGGRFVGAIPLPGHAGVVLDVSADGRWVAVGSSRIAPHGSEDELGYAIGVIDTRTERRLSVAATGTRARFVGGDRVALETREDDARFVDVLHLPDGARERRVPVDAHAEYGGLVAVDARWLVLAEDAHLRVIALADGTERALDLAPCAIEHGAIAHDRLVMRVYDRTTSTIGLHRIEAIDLSGSALRTIATVSGADGHDVAIAASGASATYVTRAGVVSELDLVRGTSTAVAGLPAGVSGATPTPGGWLTARRNAVTSEVFVGEHATGTTLLDWTRAADHAGAAIVYELGGTAFVIGHDGRTRAVIEVLDEGLVVRTPSGAFSVTPEARASLRVPTGDTLSPCDGTREAQHLPGLLEALLE